VLEDGLGIVKDTLWRKEPALKGTQKIMKRRKHQEELKLLGNNRAPKPSVAERPTGISTVPHERCSSVRYRTAALRDEIEDKGGEKYVYSIYR